MNIAVDFDGTCVTHEFPRVGKDIGAQRVLRKLIDNGHNFFLWTMRSNSQEKFETDVLEDAVNWFKTNEIPLIGVNANPGQETWTKSPKIYAPLYIDDAALGCPLKFDPAISKRPFVDWGKAELMLIEMGLIKLDAPINNIPAD